MKESNRAPQHLSLAGLIPGAFTGVYGAPLTALAPRSKFPGGWYRFATRPTVYRQPPHNFVMIAKAADYTTQFDRSLFTTPEAHYIGSKMDDGDADRGHVNAFNGGNSPFGRCTTNGAPQSGGNYILADTDTHCVMTFKVP